MGGNSGIIGDLRIWVIGIGWDAWNYYLFTCFDCPGLRIIPYCADTRPYPMVSTSSRTLLHPIQTDRLQCNVHSCDTSCPRVIHSFGTHAHAWIFLHDRGAVGEMRRWGNRTQCYPSYAYASFLNVNWWSTCELTLIYSPVHAWQTKSLRNQSRLGSLRQTRTHKAKGSSERKLELNIQFVSGLEERAGDKAQITLMPFAQTWRTVHEPWTN